MNAIKTYPMPHGLTLAHDDAAPDFYSAWAVLEEGWRPAAEGVEEYEAWWQAVNPFLLRFDYRVVAVLAERFAWVEISL